MRADPGGGTERGGGGPHPLAVFLLGLLLAYIGYRMGLQGWRYVGEIRTAFGFVFAWGALVSGAIIAGGGALGALWGLWCGIRWLVRRLTI